MKLDIIANDGSPLGVSVKDIYGKGKRGIGVGGAEIAILTLCEAWSCDGHDVTFYNDPLEENGSCFEQRPKSAFDPSANRDAVIIFRSPNPNGIIAKGLRIWLSTDQYTQGSFRDFAPHVDKVVTISPFHTKYFEQTYGIKNAIDIDLPVRVQDFEDICEVKIPYRLIFTSVPDRGLHLLHPMWAEIKLNFPEASLVITSDYRLWGVGSPQNERHLLQWLRAADVQFMGAIPRSKLIEEQLKAELLVYPGVYDELFCVAVAEAQFAGAYPITSSTGALETTNMGTVVSGNPSDGDFRRRFIGEIIENLGDLKGLTHKQEIIKKKALFRFHPNNILEQWENRVFNV